MRIQHPQIPGTIIDKPELVAQALIEVAGWQEVTDSPVKPRVSGKRNTTQPIATGAGPADSDTTTL